MIMPRPVAPTFPLVRRWYGVRHEGGGQPGYGTMARWYAPRPITAANSRVSGANVQAVNVLSPASRAVSTATSSVRALSGWWAGKAVALPYNGGATAGGLVRGW